MAKGNMLQGQARGKVGDVVFSVLKGQQVSKVYNAKPSNPRTTAQMAQRVKLGAVVAFYRRHTKFFKFAFTKKATESDYNAFVRANINVSPYLTKEAVVSNLVCPAPYIMTQGILPEVQGIVSSSVTIEDVMSSAAFLDGGYVSTFSQLRERVGASFGDMLTVYSVWSVIENGTQDSPILTSGLGRGHAKVVFTEEKENLSVLEAGNWDEVLNLASIRSSRGPQGQEGLQLAFSNELSAKATDETICSGCCAVVSRKTAGTALMVSNSRLALNPLGVTCYNKYRTEGQLYAAMNSYGRGDNAFLDPESAKPRI